MMERSFISEPCFSLLEFSNNSLAISVVTSFNFANNLILLIGRLTTCGNIAPRANVNLDTNPEPAPPKAPNASMTGDCSPSMDLKS